MQSRFVCMSSNATSSAAQRAGGRPRPPHFGLLPPLPCEKLAIVLRDQVGCLYFDGALGVQGGLMWPPSWTEVSCMSASASATTSAFQGSLLRRFTGRCPAYASHRNRPTVVAPVDWFYAGGR